VDWVGPITADPGEIGMFPVPPNMAAPIQPQQQHVLPYTLPLYIPQGCARFFVVDSVLAHHNGLRSCCPCCCCARTVWCIGAVS
jgi:hypothetical protein